MRRRFIGLSLAGMALALIAYGCWATAAGYYGSGVAGVGLALFLLLGAVAVLRSRRT